VVTVGAVVAVLAGEEAGVVARAQATTSRAITAKMNTFLTFIQVSPLFAPGSAHLSGD
jgi:hypothetical protein